MEKKFEDIIGRAQLPIAAYPGGARRVEGCRRLSKPVEPVAPVSGEIWRPIPEKIVFLDFDGVLHRGCGGTFRKLPMFEQWLTAWASTRDRATPV